MSAFSFDDPFAGIRTSLDTSLYDNWNGGDELAMLCRSLRELAARRLAGFALEIIATFRYNRLALKQTKNAACKERQHGT